MTKKRVIAATVAIVVGNVCMVLGYGPLAWEPTVVLSFVVLLLGGILTSFGMGFVLLNVSTRRAVAIGTCYSLIVVLLLGWHIMSNPSRAKRVLAAFGVNRPTCQEMGKR